MRPDPTLAAGLDRLESTRRHSLRKIHLQTALYTLALLPLCVGFMIFLEVGSDGFGLVLWPVAMAGGLGYYFYKWLTNKAKAGFKSLVIPVMLKDISPGLSYQQDQSIPLAELRAAGLFRQWRISFFEGRDLISGKLGETNVRLALTRILEERDRSMLDQIVRNEGINVSHTETVTLFEGLLCVADLHRPLRGQTTLNQKGKSFLQDLLADRIELGDPEFSALFTIHTSDPDEARELLSPALRKGFKTLCQRGDVIAAFADGKLWIALDMPADVLDPDLYVPFTDDAQLTRIMASLHAITGILAEMGLNRGTGTPS